MRHREDLICHRKERGDEKTSLEMASLRS